MLDIQSIYLSTKGDCIEKKLRIKGKRRLKILKLQSGIDINTKFVVFGTDSC